jgi:hypothetical protein
LCSRAPWIAMASAEPRSGRSAITLIYLPSGIAMANSALGPKNPGNEAPTPTRRRSSRPGCRPLAGSLATEGKGTPGYNRPVNARISRMINMRPTTPLGA